MLSFSVIYGQYDSIVTKVWEINWEGQNFLMKNPWGDEETGFCIKGIRGNGETLDCDLNSTEIIIPAHSIGLNFGDSMIIEIDHFIDCSPQWIYIDPPYQAPEFRSITYHDSVLEWDVSNDYVVEGTYIEQKLWGEWTSLPPYWDGKFWTPQEENKERIDFDALERGQNKLRVCIKTKTREQICSDPIELTIRRDPVTLAWDQESSVINLSAKCNFRVKNPDGKVIIKDFGDYAYLGSQRKLKDKFIVEFDGQEKELSLPQK